jgi:hypothetical protein
MRPGLPDYGFAPLPGRLSHSFALQQSGRDGAGGALDTLSVADRSLADQARFAECLRRASGEFPPAVRGRLARLGRDDGA